MKIVFLDSATLGQDVSLEPIASLGELVCYERTRPEDVFERIADCEVLIINKIKIGKPQIDAAPKLRLICEAATGVNNIDVSYAESRGIPVRNVAAYSTESVVQTTFMHLLTLVQGHGYFDRFVKDGRYSRSGSFTCMDIAFGELDGKNMGIIGLGTIGSRVARVAAAFGMKVCYYSTSGTSHSSEYPSLSLAELMSQSDVISVHAPLNARTDGLVGYRELSLMKRSAYILNMGRGGIVVEADLARALDEGLLAGAGLDVFGTEPLPSDHPFLHMAHPERLSLTPHIAWASIEARRRLVSGIAANIAAFCNE
ncbi:MAG: D-2-hydroxyacid dehydrogenase [Bacteroidales bacterium]|nr:D-2-hydroxyacid dehydrogenase [Bacteroidales bacterium]